MQRRLLRLSGGRVGLETGGAGRRGEVAGGRVRRAGVALGGRRGWSPCLRGGTSRSKRPCRWPSERGRRCSTGEAPRAAAPSTRSSCTYSRPASVELSAPRVEASSVRVCGAAGLHPAGAAAGSRKGHSPDGERAAAAAARSVARRCGRFWRACGAGGRARAGGGLGADGWRGGGAELGVGRAGLEVYRCVRREAEAEVE